MDKNIFQKRADYGFQKTFSTDAERDAYLNKLAASNRQRLGLSPQPNTPKLYWIGAAASVAILVVVGLLFGLQPDQAEPIDLFAAHYTPLAYSGKGLMRGQEERSTTADFPTEAVQAYQENNLETAATLLQNHLTQHPEDTEHRLYFGLSLILDEPARAAAELKKVAANASRAEVRETAVWYRSLALVKAGQQASACALLAAYQEDMSDFLREKRALFLKDCE